MDYMKETEKYSFGFGTKKVAGKGNLSETENENTEFKKAVGTVVLASVLGIIKAIRKHKK